MTASGSQPKTAQRSRLLGTGPSEILHAAEVVARSNGYDLDELLDSHHVQPLCLRQALYWACHELLGCSYPLIGQALGKDHTTVLAGARRFAALAATDPALAETAQRTAEVASEPTPAETTQRIAEANDEQPGRWALPGVLVVAGLGAEELVATRRWLAANVPLAEALVAGG